MNNIYNSNDFYLCGYLLSVGIPLFKYYKVGKTTTFQFEPSSELEDEVKKYYSMAAKVNPITYGQSLKSLKSIIHSNTNIYSNPNVNYERDTTE